MKHQIRAVLFDLDGVLVFTDRYHYQAWKKLADEQGWKFDEQVNHHLRGVPRMRSLELILEHNGLKLSEPEKLRLADRKNEYYVQLIGRIGPDAIYPGALDLLKKLKAEGTRLAICSSSKNARTVVDGFNLGSFFDTVVTGSDFSKGKPDPEIFLLGAKRLAIPPFHCLVFEDAESGVQAALRAGMKCVGVGAPEVLPSAPQTVRDYASIDVPALLDTGRITAPPAEPWSLTETALEPARAQYWESLFALSNGYLGLRGTYEEDDPQLARHAYPGMFINGVYEYRPYHYEWAFPGFPARGHAMLNLCDWRIIQLYVEGERFSMLTGKVSEYARRLDLQRGVVTRSLVWESPQGRRVRLRTTRLVSMTRPHSAAIRYEVTPLDRTARITLESVVRPQAPSQVLPGHHTEILTQKMLDQTWLLEVKTKVAPIRVGMAFRHQIKNPSPSCTHEWTVSDSTVTESFQAACPAGQTLTLDKFAAFYDALNQPAAPVLDQACAEVAQSAVDGFDHLLAEQEQFWAAHWRAGDVEIAGNVPDQQALRFSLFHLRQSAPQDPTRSIGANGLTGDKYCGHVFWDTELYIAPYLLYTDPALVRPLLMYRHHLLDRARERARQMEGQGALYSWNSISGEECGIVYEAATAEYHLLNAIAMAIWRYWQQSGDDQFLYQHGAEIIFETARFLSDRGKFIPHRGGKFCLNAVCGPDEYGCAVNNNCYTNVMTQWHLRLACTLYRQFRQNRPDEFAALVKRIALSDEEAKLWHKAAEQMYIPYSKDLGIHAQDDAFLNLDPVDMSQVPLNTDIRERHHPLNLWRMQVSKQADVVLLMYLQGDQFTLAQKRANYEFYEPRTCHGSSLSACIHSIVASEIGASEAAYLYFRQSARMDLSDFKNNTAAGVHSACLGGTWQALVNGFGGMRDYRDGLKFAPRLPQAWTGYQFQVNYRGSRLRVTVARSGAKYELLTGPSVQFESAGQSVKLTPEKPIMEAPLAG